MALSSKRYLYQQDDLKDFECGLRLSTLVQEFAAASCHFRNPVSGSKRPDLMRVKPEFIPATANHRSRPNSQARATWSRIRKNIPKSRAATSVSATWKSLSARLRDVRQWRAPRGFKGLRRNFVFLFEADFFLLIEPAHRPPSKPRSSKASRRAVTFRSTYWLRMKLKNVTCHNRKTF